MDKKQYEVKRAELLAKMKAAIEAEDVAVAQATNEEIKALDAKFQALATAQANFAALNGMNRPATVPEIPGTLNSAGMPGVDLAAAAKAEAEKKATEEKLYMNAFAHYMMGTQMSAEEQEIFNAKNEAGVTNTKNNRVVVPTTVQDGIWHEIEELHPIIADTKYTRIPGDIDILIEETAGDDGNWYDEETAVAAEKVKTGKVTLKGYELAKAVSVSWKLKKMAVDEFLAYIQTRIAEKMSNAIANALVNGKGETGTAESPAPGEPTGVITKLEAESGTPQVLTYTAADGITYEKMTGFMAVVKSGYKTGAKIYAKSTTIWNQLANIVDKMGRPIFVADATAGGVGRIFGVPVAEEDAVPEDGVMMGNMARGYAMNVNEDVTMYFEDHMKERTTDYMGYCLADGTVKTTKAFAYLKKS